MIEFKIVTKGVNIPFSSGPILAALDNGSKSQFMAEVEGNRLVNAWPFIVSNITQKTGKVNVTFRAPSAPGKYKFYIDVKSQEFLGVDQTFSIEKEIIDKALLERKEEAVEGEAEDEEPKRQSRETYNYYLVFETSLLIVI